MQYLPFKPHVHPNIWHAFSQNTQAPGIFIDISKHALVPSLQAELLSVTNQPIDKVYASESTF
jgi:hypothetical protein